MPEMPTYKKYYEQLKRADRPESLELDFCPIDPNRWPTAKPRCSFRVGDTVRTPDGYTWKVIEVHKTWTNRADEVVRRNMYRLDVQLPGSPICVFPGWQLELVKRG